MKARSMGVAATAILSLGAAVAPAVAATILFTELANVWSDPTAADAVSLDGAEQVHAPWNSAGPAGGSTALADAVQPLGSAPLGHHAPAISVGSITHVAATEVVGGVDVRNFAYGVGQKSAGCDEQRDASAPSDCEAPGEPLKSAELVKIDGKYYALDISGLVHNGNPVEEFWTREQDDGSAELRAQLRLVSAAVPEPANWAMMIVGFGIAGAAVRAGRRRNILATVPTT
ncbi:MAG: PEPxxWA-CTERM sorting domain-containing protein [Phenylobacterium sp.]|nr:PEPxxWA-CTERM sorting domain-containing protein [Phenylobacterium sp.]